MPRTRKKTASSDEQATLLALEKLEQSGLDADDAASLGLQFLSGEQAAKLGLKPLAGILIPYFDASGAKTGFWRYRYLEKKAGFDQLTDKKELRYVQPPKTAPRLYFPRGGVDWAQVVSDVEQDIIITEGEFKAACATRYSIPTVGLGGVWTWRAPKQGIDWIEDMKAIDWRGRNVYLCFDSDYRSNPDVLTALEILGDQLVRRGAYVYLLSLPDVPGLKKTGLDDYIVSEGSDAFDGLMTLAEMHGLAQPLWELNKAYTYVRDPGLVFDNRSRSKVSPDALIRHRESTSVYLERFLKADGSTGHREVSAAQAWMKWPLRAEVQCMTYAPGKPQFINGDSPPKLNLWPGWGVEARKGDARPFLYLVDHLFTGAEPAAKEWFLRWCAYPLQHPGTKMYSSAVIHGIKHGTGKSLVGYTLGRIYGENFTEISSKDIHADFNEWAENKQFIMGDDVTGSNRRQDSDFLKKIITQLQLRVNIKFVPTYTVPDCINYYFTSNHPDAFFLEDDDRRYFIHEVMVGNLPDEFYQKYQKWLEDGGAAAVFDYLLHLDLGDFNPAARAYATAAKERMIANLRSDVGAWVRNLVADPDSILRVGAVRVERDLWTSKELLTFYDPEGKSSTSAGAMGRELARAGVRQACDGKPVRGADGVQGRYYILRNPGKWLGASAAEVSAHIAPKEPKAPKY